METLWFVVVVLMLGMYVVLDGFDFGTGIIYLYVARSDSERRLVLRAIGPVWNGNEVWLIAGGGLLFFAFPKAFAAGFSGFYLALFLVLWLLMFRGLALELRSHFKNPLWRGYWDLAFAGASLLLALVFGAALGNLVRGVPLNEEGFFHTPFWTTWIPGSNPGILDWFTVLMGLVTAAILTHHGAVFLAMKTEGDVHMRSRQLAEKSLWVVVFLTLLAVVVTPFVQPFLLENYAAHPFGYLLSSAALLGLAGMLYYRKKGHDVAAFFASCLFILFMLGSTAWGLYPNLLISSTDSTLSLTAYNTAASPYGLEVGLVWFSFGFTLILGYTIYVYRSFWGKVSPGSANENH